MFILLLASLVNAFNHTNYASLCYQKFMTQPTIINLHPNEYTQRLHYYLFALI